jgi:hypothetical protein
MIRAGLSDLGLCIAVAACGASETISTSADAGGDASMIADASMNTDAVDGMPSELAHWGRAMPLAALGVACSLAGEHDDALPLLEEAIALGGLPSDLARRTYHLALSLDALGRRVEARDLLMRVCTEWPATEGARLAREHLEDTSLAPFRS